MLRHVSMSILAVAVVGVECAIAQVTPPKPKAPPAVTKVLPASTAGVVLFNTTPEAWADLNRFNPLSTDLLPPLNALLRAFDLKLTEDIQPWLGDQVAIALMPAADQATSLTTKVVLLASIKNANQFNGFLEKVKASWGEPQIERDYKGVTLLQWISPSVPLGPEIQIDPLEKSEESPVTPVPCFPRFSTQFHLLSQACTQLKNEPDLNAIKAGGSDSLPEVETQTAPSDSSPSEGNIPEQSPSRSIVMALLPDSVAVAAQAKALETLIDARSAEPESLAQSPLFQRTMNHPQFERSLVVGYGDVAGFVRYLSILLRRVVGMSDAAPLPILEESQIALFTRVYNSVDTYLWVQPQGLRGQTNFYYTTPQPELVTRPVANANQILTRLPAITYLSANSRNFKQQWQSFLDSAFASPTSQPLLNNIRRQFRNSTGFDLQDDIIRWMDGEYAFFMFPATQGFFNTLSPRLNMEIGVMLQTSDRPAAETFLSRLNESVRSAAPGEVAIVPRQVGGLPIISWEGKDRNKTVSILSHGWVSDDTLVITTGAGAMSALLPKPYLPLHLNPTFQTATASFPNPNEGYFYVNMGASLSLLYGMLLPSMPREYDPFLQEFQRILGTVRSVSSSNSATAEAQRVDTLWVLGERRGVRSEE